METLTKPKKTVSNRTIITLNHINNTQRSRLFSYMEKENLIFEAREKNGIVLSDAEIARLEKSEASGICTDISVLEDLIKSKL